MAGVSKSPKMWLDGQFVDWDTATVPFLTHSLHYGLGVFEGIRCYALTSGGSAVFRLPEHVARLYQSAHMCLLHMPLAPTLVEAAILESFRINQLAAGYARPLAFLGDGAMGLGAANPTRLGVAVWPWATYLGDEGVRRGIRAKISSLNRLNAQSSMVRGKISGQYVNSILAQREAQLAGCDEAILLDDSGLVAEGPGENIFIVKDGVLFTPPLSSPILAGITRDAVLRLAADHGLEAREQAFTRGGLYIADEAFFCGTAAEITPIREVDGRTIGAGEPGPVTQRLQGLYHQAVRGELPRYHSWLARV